MTGTRSGSGFGSPADGRNGSAGSVPAARAGRQARTEPRRRTILTWATAGVGAAATAIASAPNATAATAATAAGSTGAAGSLASSSPPGSRADSPPGDPSGRPTTIPLPDGFAPEGIAIGPTTRYAYFGSLADGALYRADLRTARGQAVSPGAPGTVSVGLKLDEWRGRLFVAGGAGGTARVVSTRTGEVLASYQVATGTHHFVNDVVLASGAAWFTDSFHAVLYGLPLARDGRLPGPEEVVRLPLTGDWRQVPGEDAWNANGIALTPDRRALLVVQGQHGGEMHRVDPRTGRTTRVRLTGAGSLADGDGLVVHGRTLYVVQNGVPGSIDVFRLSDDGTRGALQTRITDERFDTPTTAAVHGRRLYVVNARFTTEPTPTTPYSAVSVPLPLPLPVSLPRP